MLPTFMPLSPTYLSSKSPEFLLAVGFLFFCNLVGSIYIYKVGKRLAPAFRKSSPFLRYPHAPFSYLGSVGEDVNDFQLRSFVENLPLLSVIFFFFVIIGRFVRNASMNKFCRQKDTTVHVGEKTSEWNSERVIREKESELLKEEEDTSCALFTNNGSNTNEHLRTKDNKEVPQVNLPAEDGSQNTGNSLQGDSEKNVLIDGSCHRRSISPGVSRFPTFSKLRFLLKAPHTHDVKTDSLLKWVPTFPMFLYHIIFGLVLVFFISGPKVIFELGLFLFNYCCISTLDRFLPFPLCMLIMWSFMVGSLFLNFYLDGWRLAWLGLPTWMDENSVRVTWTIHYNMGVLRMIAFNNDMWDSKKGNAKNRRKETYRKHHQNCVDCALLRESAAALIPTYSEENSSSLYCSRKISTSTQNSSNQLIATNPKSATHSAQKHSPDESYNVLSVLPIGIKSPSSPRLPNGSNVTLETHSNPLQNAAQPEKSPLSSEELEEVYSSSPHQVLVSCYKCRSDTPCLASEYSIFGYFAFLLYPPLFFSGPMMSYNAYVSLVSRPSIRFSMRNKVSYGIRVLCNLFCLIALIHYLFLGFFMFGSIRTIDVVLLGFDVPQDALAALGQNINARMDALAMLSFEGKCYLTYISLAFLWCKFNVIWKFFRFVAMADGFDIPEDMPHCFSNTTSITDFWQSWHASFNLWIVRYMYIPMGGNKRKAFTIVPIFLFIAVWHDIELRLVKWAIVTCISFIPEILITGFFTKTKWKPIVYLRQRFILWRLTREVGTAFGQIALVAANVIGFAISNSGAVLSMKFASSQKIPTVYILLFFSFYFCSAKLSVRSRDKEQFNLECSKRRLKLL